tara:strand:+ start:21240 stop:21704 length:465 start_codon:yes stop_codon:yes gene_type:complete
MNHVNALYSNVQQAENLFVDYIKSLNTPVAYLFFENEEQIMQARDLLIRRQIKILGVSVDSLFIKVRLTMEDEAPYLISRANVYSALTSRVPPVDPNIEKCYSICKSAGYNIRIHRPISSMPMNEKRKLHTACLMRIAHAPILNHAQCIETFSY